MFGTVPVSLCVYIGSVAAFDQIVNVDDYCMQRSEMKCPAPGHIYKKTRPARV